MTHQDHPNVTLVREGFAAFERGDMAKGGWPRTTPPLTHSWTLFLTERRRATTG